MNVLHFYCASEQQGDFLWSEASDSAANLGNQESQLRMLLSKLNELFHVHGNACGTTAMHSLKIAAKDEDLIVFETPDVIRRETSFFG